MSDFEDIINVVLELRRDLEDHKIATRNMLRVGPVKERDHEKGVRVEHGTDEEPDPSPWLQMSERSGVERDLPNEGEQLVVLSPYGDPEQGIALPFGHSDKKKNPASHADETVVFNRGKVKISIDNKSGNLVVQNDKAKWTMKGDQIESEVDGKSKTTQTAEKITSDVDGNKTEQSKSETKFGDGKVKHQSANIGRDHTHKGVMPGAGNTQNPND